MSWYESIKWLIKFAVCLILDFDTSKVTNKKTDYIQIGHCIIASYARNSEGISMIIYTEMSFAWFWHLNACYERVCVQSQFTYNGTNRNKISSKKFRTKRHHLCARGKKESDMRIFLLIRNQIDSQQSHQQSKINFHSEWIYIWAICISCAIEWNEKLKTHKWSSFLCAYIFF